MTTFFTVIFSIVLGLAIVGVMVARHSEKKSFNNGYCKVCNDKLRQFDNDSQGGRGYCCDNCGRIVWVSYKVDKDFEI